MRNKLRAVGVFLLACSSLAFADDLTINLKGTHPVTRKSARYQCDANAAKLGLPATPFTIDYINSGKNSLAVLPISGESLIFSGVSSGSGARYAAGNYIWWEAVGRSITLTADTMNGQVVSSCQILR